MNLIFFFIRQAYGWEFVSSVLGGRMNWMANWLSGVVMNGIHVVHWDAGSIASTAMMEFGTSSSS